ncbi:MAG: histidine kinase [Gammaproteobacteria bacterium BRH_c0]|nr:MAG: histidine kinase [Gammaproteobacteria bacterium BRH_c0]
MKLTRKVLSNSVAAVVLATAGLAVSSNAAAVEVSASAAVASTYLWRGYDLGSGTPAVSGDINASAGGAYAGVWGSSGDTAAGSEYDLYAGYGVELGGFSIDLSVWNYNYPTGAGYTPDGETDFGDLTDVVLSLGYGPFSFAYYDNVAGAAGYEYYTLGAEFGKFAVLLGKHDNVSGDDPVHLNLTYSYNDNLAFTISQFIADETDDDDLKFVASYSIPIGE